MTRWRVSLHGKNIDTVWFMSNLDAAYVLLALINHDGYNPLIRVRKSK